MFFKNKKTSQEGLSNGASNTDRIFSYRDLRLEKKQNFSFLTFKKK